jgi:F-type H+-transporting ATPase subunit a
MSEIHISFTAEKLTEVFGIIVTNSMLTAILGVILLIIVFVAFRFKMNAFKPTKTEIFVEMIYDALLSLVNEIMGKANARKFFGFVTTFMILIVFWNLLGLIPLVPALGFIKHAEISENPTLACKLLGNCLWTVNGWVEHAKIIPILRAPTADLSSTLGLALISVITTNIIGLAHFKLGYLSKYFDTTSFVNFLVGVLELISEFGKIISFSFRLFGNIFAGEVLLAVITSLTFGVFTLPFLGLEIFVGFIQAFVFFMLTSVFISFALKKH